MGMQDLAGYINVDEALGRIRGNQKLFKTLLRSFTAGESWDQLRAQVDKGDLENAAKTAHAIKGIAGNLSMGALYEAVVAFEAQLKGGLPHEEGYAKLQDIMENTHQAIAEVMATLP